MCPNDVDDDDVVDSNDSVDHLFQSERSNYDTTRL